MKRMQLDTFPEPAIHDRPIFAARPAIYTEWSRLAIEGLSRGEYPPLLAPPGATVLTLRPAAAGGAH